MSPSRSFPPWSDLARYCRLCTVAQHYGMNVASVSSEACNNLQRYLHLEIWRSHIRDAGVTSLVRFASACPRSTAETLMARLYHFE